MMVERGSKGDAPVQRQLYALSRRRFTSVYDSLLRFPHYTQSSGIANHKFLYVSKFPMAWRQCMQRVCLFYEACRIQTLHFKAKLTSSQTAAKVTMQSLALKNLSDGYPTFSYFYISISSIHIAEEIIQSPHITTLRKKCRFQW